MLRLSWSSCGARLRGRRGRRHRLRRCCCCCCCWRAGSSSAQQYPQVRDPVAGRHRQGAAAKLPGFVCVGFTKSQSDEDEKAKVEWTISAPTNRVYVDHELAGDTYQIRKTDNAVGSDASPYEIELDGGGTANLYLFKLDALDTSDSCFACLEQEAAARDCLTVPSCQEKAFDTGGMAISEKAPNQVDDLGDGSDANLDGRRIELTFTMPLSKGLPITSLVVRRQADFLHAHGPLRRQAACTSSSTIAAHDESAWLSSYYLREDFDHAVLLNRLSEILQQYFYEISTTIFLY